MVVINYLSELYRSALNVIYPPLCLVCESDLGGAELVCDGCEGNVVRLDGPVCPRCGAPGGGSGRSCVCHHLVTGLELLRSTSLYKGVAKDIIHHFKFGGYRGLAARMADMMVEDGRRLVEMEGEIEENVVVIGVPLHRVRLRERGYDQAKLLAQALSVRLGLEYADSVLGRSRNSKPQARLSLEERRSNIQGAFRIDDPAVIDHRTVLLVDDVCTTGITLSSCAEVLSGAGARSVLALTFARRILENEDAQRRRAGDDDDGRLREQVRWTRRLSSETL